MNIESIGSGSGILHVAALEHLVDGKIEVALGAGEDGVSAVRDMYLELFRPTYLHIDLHLIRLQQHGPQNFVAIAELTHDSYTSKSKYYGRASGFTPAEAFLHAGWYALRKWMRGASQNR